MNARFPGCGLMILKIMDYDDLFGDDMIGQTIIDLEDRFFSHQWKSLRNKPIETRDLMHPTSSQSQG